MNKPTEQFPLKEIVAMDPKGKHLDAMVNDMIAKNFWSSSEYISEVPKILKEIWEKLSVENVETEINHAMVEEKLTKRN